LQINIKTIEKLKLEEYRNIIKKAEHQADLNFNLNIDVDKRIYDKLHNKYENVFEMDGEFLLVIGKNEYFRKNKYAKEETK